MNIRELNSREVETVYKSRLIKDFPPNEVKSLRRIRTAAGKGGYRCFGLAEGDNLLAYAFFMVLEGHMLLDYYAVRQDLRGTGLGSRFLKMMCEGVLKEQECVLLETEDPDTVPEGAEKDKRERRLRFYLKNSLRDTGLRTCVYDADYRVMQMPVGTQQDPEAVLSRYTAHYHAMLPDSAFNRHVKIKKPG